MNHDAYQPSGRPSKPSTQHLPTSGSAGLPRAGSGLAGSNLRAEAVRLVAGLEPRVELLVRACREAGLPLPGVPTAGFKHPLPPTAERTLAYLVRAFDERPPLAQAVQVVIFRFQQIGASLAGTGVEPDDAVLRRHLFALSNLAVELQGDRVLATLFPPPTQHQGTLAPAPVSPKERQQLDARRDAVATKALALQQALAPRMAVVRLVFETLDKGLAHNLASLLTPQGRQAKLIAASLLTDPPVTARLRTAYATFERLVALVPAVRSGRQPIDALRPVVAPLGDLAEAFRDQPLLVDLFTRPAAI